MSIKDNYRFSLSTSSKTESERLVLLLTIGLAVALRKKVISLNEVEQYLFSPYSMNNLDKYKFENEIIDIIHLWTKLEDGEGIIPNGLSITIENVLNQSLNCLKKLPRSDFNSFEKWIDRFDEQPPKK